MFKYGVVSEDELMKDLLTWENYFLAGRMQKPILYSDLLGEPFVQALVNNRRNGV